MIRIKKLPESSFDTYNMLCFRNEKLHGFTVIEVLTATAISGLLIATITPYFHQLTKKLQVHQTCDTVAQRLQELLPLALLTRQTASLHTNPGLYQTNRLTGPREIKLPAHFNYQTTKEIINCYKTSACNPASLTIATQDYACHISLSIRGRVKITMDPD